MSKKIKLFYAEVPNMGDLLNPIIVERVLGVKVKRSPLYASQLIAIGSGMNALLKSDNKKTLIKQKVLRMFSDQLHVWGTGFISAPDTSSSFFSENIEFNSVRGELSKIQLEKILNKKLNITTGDAGLLANLLFEKKLEKKYKLGIIPHFRHQDNPVFDELKNKYSNSIIIDLKKEPISVIEMIGQCDFIISSSLHGLIVADSFNVPNIHLNISQNIKGDGFKFADYYSSFGVEHIQLTEKSLTDNVINTIIDNYKLNDEIVDIKRKEIINAFPFK